MDDGRMIFLELPPTEPIPVAVREKAKGEGVEALLLEAYRGWPRRGEAPDALSVTVLANGEFLF